MVTTRIERFLFSTRLCCSDLQWPLAANFCSLLTGKSQLVIAIICWAPWTSLVQSTGLRSMFLIVQPCIVLCDIKKTLLIRKPLITFRPRIIKPQDPRDDGQRRVPRFFFSFSRMLRAMPSSRWAYNVQCRLQVNTVEPHLVATSVIVSPRYYSHFCLATQQNGHTFSGCSLGIGDRRILCLLCKIVRLTFGCLWLFFMQTWSVFYNVL